MPEFYVSTFRNNLSHLHRQKFEIKNNSPLWDGNCKTHSIIIWKTQDLDHVSTYNSDAGESTKRKKTTFRIWWKFMIKNVSAPVSTLHHPTWYTSHAPSGREIRLDYINWGRCLCTSSMHGIDGCELVIGETHHRIIVASQYFNNLMVPVRTIGTWLSMSDLWFFSFYWTSRGWHPSAKTCKSLIP